MGTEMGTKNAKVHILNSGVGGWGGGGGSGGGGGGWKVRFSSWILKCRFNQIIWYCEDNTNK